MVAELKGQFVASLALEDDFPKNAGMVVTVSTEQLRYVRRKELALTAYEIEAHDLSGCRSVTYQTDLAPFRMLMGALALSLAAIIGIGLFLYHDRIGARVPVFAILFLAYVGYRYLAGGRRHKLAFIFDDRTLKWTSRPGEFEIWAVAVDSILNFARGKGWYENPMDVR